MTNNQSAPSGIARTGLAGGTGSNPTPATKIGLFICSRPESLVSTRHIAAGVGCAHNTPSVVSTRKTTASAGAISNIPDSFTVAQAYDQ